MSIRAKTLLIIGSTLTVLIIAMYALSQIILLESYVQLEEQTVGRDVQRALNALNDKISVMHSTNVDWAHWNDSYEFVDDLNQEYIDANTYDGTFLLYGLNAMLFVNMENEIVFSKGFDLENGVEVPVIESLAALATDPDSPLGQIDDAGELIVNGVGGLLMLPEGPILVASTAILPTDLSGDSRGRLIWGTFLDETSLAALAEQTQTSLTLVGLDNPVFQSIDLAGVGQNYVAVQTPDSQTIYGSALVTDIVGQPALWMQVDLARSIYNQGQTSLTYFLLLLFILGGVFAVATVLLLERVVLSRLAYLHQSVVNIPNDRIVSPEIKLGGHDELSSLANAMNTTFESLVHTQERLKQARDHALEASRARAQILANVSHDARTPLSVIILRADMLKKELYGTVNPKQNSMLESILASAKQLLGFISNLLDGAQLESGKLQLRKAMFSPTVLTESIKDAFIPLIGHKGLALNTSVDPGLPERLYGDAERLTQILFNLVGNAIKFTSTGSVDIRLRCMSATQWSMEVSDTGIGIAPEHQGRIFESFWQVDGTSSRLATTGVGLGLSIVKQLTTMMGGYIELKSEANKGSVFTIVLPIEALETLQGEPDVRSAIRVNN